MTVRQVPLTLMLSPRWASTRISAQFEMVRLVPPPPLEVSSCWARRETAGVAVSAPRVGVGVRGRTAYGLHDAGEHDGGYEEIFWFLL